MLALPRFGSSKSFALYYKRVLESINTPRIAPEIIQVIVNLVRPLPEQWILYRGYYNHCFKNAAFADILTDYNLDVRIVCNDISPFIEDHSLEELLHIKQSNLNIIISTESDNEYYEFAVCFIKALLASPLFIENNLNVINSNTSVCHHPLYWIGRNAQNCAMNLAHSDYCQSIRYFEEFLHYAYYESLCAMQTLLLSVYNLTVLPKHILENNNLITRQFHDCVFDKHSQQLIIFGGYGTSIAMRSNKQFKSSKLPRARLNDTICLKYDTNNNQLIYQTEHKLYSNVPKSRQHHCMLIVKNINKNNSFIFMFGGRCNPFKAFDDFWLYDIENYKWIELKVDSNIPIARYRHSMCAIDDNKVLLFGGIAIENKTQKLLNDMYVISIDFNNLMVSAQNIEYKNDGNVPVARCSMTVVCINDSLLFSTETCQKIFVFGGLINLNCYSDDMINDTNIYLFDLENAKWEVLEMFNEGPLGLYGNSYCVTGDKNNVIMCGGIMIEYDPFLDVNEIKYNENIWKIEIGKRLWHCYKIDDRLKEQQVNIAHKMIYFNTMDDYDIVWLIGGGVNVFSFGSVHSSVVQVKLPIMELVPIPELASLPLLVEAN